MWSFEIAARIAAHGVIGIVRERDRASARDAARALIDAGQIVVEVSMTTPGALDVVAELAGELAAADGVLVGVGTVLDETTARLAVLAGAQFIVAPTLNLDVLRTAHRYGLAIVPGVASPTEALAALEAGADLVKLFPASACSPAIVRDILAAVPQVPLVPTGGVTLDNAADYLRAGAVAVGMGGSLTAGTREEIRARVAALLVRVNEAKAARL